MKTTLAYCATIHATESRRDFTTRTPIKRVAAIREMCPSKSLLHPSRARFGNPIFRSVSAESARGIAAVEFKRRDRRKAKFSSRFFSAGYTHFHRNVCIRSLSSFLPPSLFLFPWETSRYANILDAHIAR